jgi:bifunctional DNA-binding transcriptional regulator/antitoxin component of YhaV-PrlF toxin-antitoxin module
MSKVKDSKVDEPRPRRRGFTRLSSKHQATIPVDALREAGLEPGDELRVTSPGPGKLLLERAEDSLDALRGSLTGVFGPGFLDELRDEWER